MPTVLLCLLLCALTLPRVARAQATTFTSNVLGQPAGGASRDGCLQWNRGGRLFACDSKLSWNDATSTFTVTGTILADNVSAGGDGTRTALDCGTEVPSGTDWLCIEEATLTTFTAAETTYVRPGEAPPTPGLDAVIAAGRTCTNCTIAAPVAFGDGTGPAITLGCTTGICVAAFPGTLTEALAAGETRRWQTAAALPVLELDNDTQAVRASGPLTGLVKVVLETAPDIPLTAADCGQTVHIVNNAGPTDFTLPPAVQGCALCVIDDNGVVMTIDPSSASEVIVLNGTPLAAGNAIDSGSVRGDSICLLAKDSTTWITWQRTGTFTDSGAD